MEASCEFEVEIGEKEICDFSTLSGDWNPLHNDPEYARTTEFGRPIAHGALMVALSSRVLGMYIPGKRSLILSLKAQYPRPLFYPTRVRVSGRLKEYDAERNLGVVHVSVIDLSRLWAVLEADVSFSLHAAAGRQSSPASASSTSTASSRIHLARESEKPLLLVTGGTGGIGSRVLPQLKERFDLVCLSRRNGGLDSSVRTCHVDLEAPGLLEDLLGRLPASDFYGIVHMSSAPVPRGFVSDDVAVVRRHLRQSVEVPLLLAKWARQEGSAVKRFLMLGSTYGTKFPKAHLGAYSLGKAAMEHLARLLTSDLSAQGATVNVVVPTVIPVGLNDGMPERARKALSGRMPTGRLLESSDIGAVIEFLLSPAAGQVNGTTLPVDGGLVD